MTASKIVAAAASSAGGGTTDIDEVFSTFLYDGNGGTQSITNNIDLSGEGGLVWIKQRDATRDHYLFDTARGVTKYIRTNVTDAESTLSTTLTAFNSNGFSLGNRAAINDSGGDYVSWTFRKAPKFFDVVTYTGNATVRTIAHNLGSTPGMIIIKKTSGTGPWYVFHRSSTDTDGKIGLQLNESDAQGDFGNTHWDVSEMSSTHFGLGNMGNMNGSGNTYVAYLFAHNNNDGGFGPDSDQDIIKCGSYTGNGNSSNGTEVNLGFEPQFLMVKRATGGSGDWAVLDTMRGWTVGPGNKERLRWNVCNIEAQSGSGFALLHTGFKLFDSDAAINGNGDTYIYMAIRRGPLAVPEDATKVFQVELGDVGDGYVSGTPELQGLTLPSGSDMVIGTRTTASANLHSARLTGSAFMSINATTAENSTDFDGFADFTQSMTDIAAGDIGGFNDIGVHFIICRRS